MGRLLFSWSGRIGPGDLLRGALFLSAVLVVIKASAAVGAELHALLVLAGLVTWWCWLALFAKRYRAAGRPPALAVLPLLALFLPASAIDAVVQQVAAPETYEALQTAILEAIEEHGALVGAMRVTESGLTEQLARETAVPVALARGAYTLGVAWLFGRSIRERGRPAGPQFD